MEVNVSYSLRAVSFYRIEFPVVCSVTPLLALV